MLRSTVAAAVSFLLFLAMHFLYFHYAMPYEKTKSVLFTAFVGLLVFGLLVYTFPPEDWFREKFHLSQEAVNRFVYPALGALFYGFLFLGYLEFYFTADRSITFRMLMIANKQPGQTITKAEMAALYDVPGIINKRFEDLTYGGYLERRGDAYHITFKGEIILNIYKIAIEELHLGSGEKTSPVNSLK